MITYLPWLAVIIISIGYAAQVWKIHEHKEVRDLSPWAYGAWGLAYCLLAYEGFLIGSTVFIIKNAITFGLVLVILGQIAYHKDDEWHDDDDKSCECGNELEPQWVFCPDCGSAIKDQRLLENEEVNTSANATK